MIGKGWLKVDDYARFGRLFEELSKAGAYNISYLPARDEILAWVRQEDLEAVRQILTGRTFEEVKLRGSLVMIRVKW